MNTESTAEIVCPYCSYEYSNSYELIDSDEVECEHCGKLFELESETIVNYTTRKVSCKNNKHRYREADANYFIVDRSMENGGHWKPLPESDYKYCKQLTCTLCGRYEFKYLSKEAYQAATAHKS